MSETNSYKGKPDENISRPDNLPTATVQLLSRKHNWSYSYVVRRGAHQPAVGREIEGTLQKGQNSSWNSKISFLFSCTRNIQSQCKTFVLWWCFWHTQNLLIYASHCLQVFKQLLTFSDGSQCNASAPRCLHFSEHAGVDFGGGTVKMIGIPLSCLSPQY